MRKGLTTLLVILLAVGALLVSCNANVEAPADELVTISFDNESSRALSSNLETFTPGAYYWKYAAKKADSSNLISGQTADYDSDPESGALWIKEGEPGFGETSGQVYTPFKVQGFSQGLWNFRLFGYKKVIGDNPATTEVVETDFEYYLLAYSGETTGVLLKQNGTNLVKAIVSPTQTGNGTLVVKITGSDKITLDPATPGLIPNTKIKLKVEKITSTATTTVFDEFVTEDYNKSLEAGTYKVTVKFTNDDASVEFASGSVVSTVYANLTTTVKGNLTEIITSAIFGAEQNPDIITTSIGTSAITQGTTESSVTFTSTTETKVAATMPTAAAKSLIAEMEQALDAKTSSSTSQTSDLTLNLSVNTTEATETTVTYEIGMEATLIYEKKDAQASQKTTTKSTVETLDDFVTVVIDLRANLQDVSVTHSGTVMTECESLDILNGKTKAQDTTGIGFYFYDSASGKLYIKTWKFSPFQLSYTVPSYVAAIGSVRYTSLKDALDAVVEGDTVTLLSNINLEISKEDAVNVDGNYAAFLVKPFNELTIDGNGKTITLSASESGIHDAILLDANGGTGGANIDNVWNIKDLNLVTSGFQVAIMLNAELDKVHVANIDNVNIVTDGESIYANGEVTVNVSDSSLTHSGEYAPGKDWVYYSAVIAGYNGSINLADCSIDSFGNAVSTFPSGGSITLTDCNVTATVVEGAAVSGNIICSRNEDYSSYPEYTGNSTITVNSGNYDGTVLVSQGWTANKTEHLYSTVKISGGDFTNFGVNVSHASGCDLAVEDHGVITGGTFDADPTDYLAPGYGTHYVSEIERWVIDSPAVIIIRGSEELPYTTLQAAFDDSMDDDVIVVLRDIDLGVKAATPLNTKADTTITLDLNGHVVSASVNGTGVRVLKNNGNMTLTDRSEAKTGVIGNYSSGDNDCTRTVENAANANLTVNTAKILSSNGQVLIITGGEVILNDGAVVKTTGVYSGNYSNGAVAIDSRGGSSLVVHEGATVYSENGMAMYLYGSPIQVTIDGGDFHCLPSRGLFGGSSASVIAATGGTYNYNPELFTASGYAVSENGGVFSIIETNPQYVDVSDISSLKAAIESATVEEPVYATLIDDAELINDSIQLSENAYLVIDDGVTLSIGNGGLLNNCNWIENNGNIVVSTSTGFISNPLYMSGNGNLSYNGEKYDDETGIYYIETPMDLQWLAVKNSGDMVDELDVRLKNDIVFPDGVEFQQIPVFIGSFDGRNNSISSIVINSASDYTGIFACLASATIKDLTITENVTALSGTTGGIAGYINEEVFFENVTLNGSVTVYGSSYGTAGFVGNVSGTDASKNIHFVNCVNNATVSAPNASIVGGFYGTATGNLSPLYVINCTNNGNVTSGGYAASVGGFKSYQSTGKTYVYGHTNTGTLISDGSTVNVVLGADGYGIVYDSNNYNCVAGENGAFVITEKQ